MSTGFRLFLLTVLVFVAVWISRYRSDDIAFWLSAPRGVQSTLEKLEGDRNPVDEIVPAVVVMDFRSPEIEPMPRSVEAPPVRGFGLATVQAGEPAIWQDQETADGIEGLWVADGEPLPPEFERAVDIGELVGVEPAGEEPDGNDAAPGPDRESPREHEAPSIERTPGPKGSAAGTRSLYTVKSGDNLSKISRRLLGRESRYREILELNDDVLHGSTLLLPGMRLRLPPR